MTVPLQMRTENEPRNPLKRLWKRRQARISALAGDMKFEGGPYFTTYHCFLILLVLGAIGLFAAGFLTYRHVVVVSTSGHVAESGLCRASGNINCDEILRSDYSILFGYFPSAVLGLMGFVFMLWLVLNGLVNNRSRKTAWAALLLYFFAAMGFSWYYAYVMAFEVDVICPWCIVVHVVNFVSLLVVLVVAIRNRRKFLLPEISTVAERLYLILGGVAISLLVFLGSVLWEKSLSFADVKDQYEALANDPVVIRAVIRGVPEHKIALTPDHPVYGSPNAPYTMILFSDFKCPLCARTDEFLKKLVDKNPETLKLVFINYPLEKQCNSIVAGDLHPGACVIARAAYAAYLLGGPKAFWAYANLLFASQKKMKPEMLPQIAGQLGLDLDKFGELMKPDSIAAKKIEQDVQIGVNMNLSSTPQIFFEGRRIPETFQGQFLVEALQSLMESAGQESNVTKLKW